jgi:branched-chain amino acid transport system substrate-binding protein
MEIGRNDASAARQYRRAWPAFVAIVLGVSLIASACAPHRPEVDPPDQAVAGATPGQPVELLPRYRRTGPQGNGASSGTIARFGAALSLTGPARLFGAAQRSGIKLAQDEINASQMLGNTRLEVIVEDDGSDREQASVVFQKFIENSHTLAILGPTLSDIALSVDPLAQQAGVPVLSISNAASGITEIGNFIFRECLSESQLTPQIIKMLRSRGKVHSAALLYSDTDTNRAGSHGFKKALQELGIRIVAEQVFTSDQTDFSPQLEEIAASRPDALFVTAPSHSAAPILVQLRQHGLSNTTVIGSSAFNSDTVVRSAGDAAEGLIVGGAWSAANPSARNQQFIQSYRARYGVDPDQLAAQAYTGVYLLAIALRDSSSASDPRAVRDALERIRNVDTPLGAFSFNEARDATYPPSVQIVHHGRLQLLAAP